MTIGMGTQIDMGIQNCYQTSGHFILTASGTIRSESIFLATPHLQQRFQCFRLATEVLDPNKSAKKGHVMCAAVHMMFAT